ncbi:hypothetical protein VR41_11535 [Streptomyces sp. NRRL B-1568]|nr:hypothetical protein VR41_11535 [Streptomyces sp. NRRL B-1568]
MSEMTGSVPCERFEALVDRSVELVRVMTGCQFALGDIALEIAPLRSHGGGSVGRCLLARRSRQGSPASPDTLGTRWRFVEAWVAAHVDAPWVGQSFRPKCSRTSRFRRAL